MKLVGEHFNEGIWTSFQNCLINCLYDHNGLNMDFPKNRNENCWFCQMGE